MGRGGLSAGLAVVALVVSTGWVAVGSGTTTPAAASTSKTKSVEKLGYIPMADGTKLAYSVELPAAKGRFPVAMAYAGYCEGSDPNCNDATNAAALLAAGYAVLGVNIRGTGCSTGTFNAFTNQEWRDGKAAVQWAGRQPWSDGHVGLFGDSFPGITQLGVAGLRPKHLNAIAPFQVTTDLYRDVAYPGGITNVGFGAFWAGIDQPVASYEGGVERSGGNKDAKCATAQGTHLTSEPAHNIALEGLKHPYVDGFWRGREPGAKVDRIDVPVFGCVTWQDDEVSSRSSSYYSQLKPSRTWVVASNGYHSMCEVSVPRITHELVAFFNHFVKGDSNGFAKKTPHTQIWHDATANRAGNDVPSWVSRYHSYPSKRVRPVALYFRPGGTLSLHPAKGDQPPTRYIYPGPSLGNENGDVTGQHNVLWKSEEPAGASVSYTTPRLRRAVEFFGSGSANVWLSSTAPDTDLQITLTEVRPDGKEVYVGRGWLCASHRALNRAKSTRMAPYQTDTKATARKLVPGHPTRMRIQLDPFDYVFRKGSSIRLWIDAPTGETGGWSFDFIQDPAVNSVYADAHHRSAIVLGYLPHRHINKAYPACDTLLNQPCRRNTVAVPRGTMTIRAGL